MYYLIDDKLERQRMLATDAVRKGEYANLVCISTTKSLREASDQIKEDAAGIFIHDSFFRNPNNYLDQKPADHIKQELENSCSRKGLLYVSFSGDYSSRNVEELKAFLPVEVFYKNLDVFLTDGSNNLRILAFGKNYHEEEINILRHKIMLKLFHLVKDEVVPIDIMRRFDELEQLCLIANKEEAYQNIVQQAKSGSLYKKKLVSILKELT